MIHRHKPPSDAQHNHCLVSDFPSSFSTQPQIHIQMSHNHGQSALKDLLKNVRKCNKTHSVTTRHGNQTFMHNDTKYVPVTQDTSALDNTPLNHSLPEQDSELSAEYSEDPDPHCDLAELHEHFQQLQE